MQATTAHVPTFSPATLASLHEMRVERHIMLVAISCVASGVLLPVVSLALGVLSMAL